MEHLTKPGYKQTELGWIPVDWDIRNIGEVVSITTGSRNTQDKIEDGDFPFFVRSQTIERINSYSYDGEAVLTAGDGVGTGKVFHYLIGKFDIHQRVYMMSEFSENLNGYYFFLYFSRNFYDRMMQMTAKSSVDSVRREMISRMPIPLPPLPEQTAIATALSDMDSYIQSLEALIAKKRLIKQGAMQELLTPKEDWEVRKLGEVFNISGGYSASRDQLSNEGYCYLHYGDIHGSEKSYVNVDNEFGDIPKLEIALAKISSKSLLKNGDVVFVDASEDMDGVSKHIIIENPQGFPFISGLHTIVAKSKTDFLDLHYKKYCFQAKYIKEQFQYFAVGTKVSGISKSSIKQIDFHYPKMQDQKEIGSILTSMDNEIQSIDNELSKALQIKQGMMQELLTGRTRLV
jgi:type I restriction enzyme S subunit